MISFLFFVSAVGHLEKYSDKNIKLHERIFCRNSEMELFFNKKVNLFEAIFCSK